MCVKSEKLADIFKTNTAISFGSIFFALETDNDNERKTIREKVNTNINPRRF
jgi:hypothetical protein